MRHAPLARVPRPRRPHRLRLDGEALGQRELHRRRLLRAAAARPDDELQLRAPLLAVPFRAASRALHHPSLWRTSSGPPSFSASSQPDGAASGGSGRHDATGTSSNFLALVEQHARRAVALDALDDAGVPRADGALGGRLDLGAGLHRATLCFARVGLKLTSANRRWRMPQTFLAVRCCSCSAFQGIQRTQQSKYACKLCNTKQSITRVFASGTGKEVRLAVQTLNRARLEAAAVAQEEANAEYEAHYEQEHPDEYAEADGEYAEEARCAQCGAATDDLDVDVGDGQLYCAACFAAYDAGDAA